MQEAALHWTQGRVQGCVLGGGASCKGQKSKVKKFTCCTCATDNFGVDIVCVCACVRVCVGVCVIVLVCVCVSVCV